MLLQGAFLIRGIRELLRESLNGEKKEVIGEVTICLKAAQITLYM
jgi:hypothetical protein